MAYRFNGSNQYLRRADLCGITGPPFSLAVWFRHTIDASEYLFGFQRDAVSSERAMVYGNPGNYLRFYYRDVYAQASAAYPQDTWNHALGVAVSDSERHVYLNGRNKGSNTTSSSAPQWQYMETSIARNGNYYYMGEAAWAALWDVALDDADAAALGAGWHPTLIRPQNLVAFWPLGGLDPQDPKDRWGGYDLTAYNAPTEVDHPAGLLYPQGPQIVAPGTAPADCPVPWHLMIGSAA